MIMLAEGVCNDGEAYSTESRKASRKASKVEAGHLTQQLMENRWTCCDERIQLLETSILIDSKERVKLPQKKDLCLRRTVASP